VNITKNDAAETVSKLPKKDVGIEDAQVNITTLQ
jgi:hypothetical protein